MADSSGKGPHGPTSERIMRHYYGARKGGEMEPRNTDTLADKIEALIKSALPDDQRLQVLICLTAKMAHTVEALLAAHLAVGTPEKRRSPAGRERKG